MKNAIMGGIAGLALIAATASAEAKQNKKTVQPRVYIGHLELVAHPDVAHNNIIYFDTKRCGPSGEEDNKTFHIKDDADGAASHVLSEAEKAHADLYIRLPPEDFNKAIVRIKPDQIMKYSKNHVCGCPTPNPNLGWR